MKPHPDLPDDWENYDWVNAVSDGSGPPPFHVRDVDACYAALPLHAEPPADRSSLTPVRLLEWRATVWLPAPQTAEPMGTPDPKFQGWWWPSGASLLLMPDADPGLPGLHWLPVPPESARQVRVAGRPMKLIEAAHADPSNGHSAWVEGYLDERTSFYAHANAPTVDERDALLSAMLTLEWQPDSVARGSAEDTGGRAGG